MDKDKHKETSWQNVHRWYDDLVGEGGHYYHEKIIFPNTLRLLGLKKESRLLDLACGQGVLSRQIPPDVDYVGVDLAANLIQAAKSYAKADSKRKFFIGDITQSLPIPKEPLFSHATCILAIQNIAQPAEVFKQARQHLLPKGGKLLLCLNHPSFRIPRQSAWGFDEATKIQYRRENGYMSAQKIPIEAHPGTGKGKVERETTTTWSFHFPLSAYSLWLKQNGFTIELIEEWCSDKVSTGGAAKWENRARQEFPLFLTILATL